MHSMIALCVLSLSGGAAASADDPGLPDPFLMRDGSRVRSVEDWTRRRGEIAELLADIEYGHMPPPPSNLAVEDETSTVALDGVADETRAVLTMGPERKVRMRVGSYVPRGKPGPFPVVLAVEPVWMDHLRPVARKLVDAGYVFAGFERHDLDADNEDRSDGVHPLYPEYDWATLAVWAWGCMRAADYLAAQPSVDAKRIALTGHSRAGKTALLAAALDERFALVVPHASGAGGTGSYRLPGPDCETLEAITDPKRFHYWFSPRLRDYAGRIDELPFDQHFLEALVAPRALLTVQGLDDRWANPSGTQQIYRAALPVYDFLGAADRNAIWFRPGGHDTTDEDWDVLLEFADHVFFAKPLRRTFNTLPFPESPAPFDWTAPPSP